LLRTEWLRSCDVNDAKEEVATLPTSAYENLNNTEPDTRSRLHTGLSLEHRKQDLSYKHSLTAIRIAVNL
jgi:hypothetical protein